MSGEAQIHIVAALTHLAIAHTFLEKYESG
jgi:hypothetical protein